MSAVALAILGIAATFGGVIHYGAAIRSGDNPRRPIAIGVGLFVGAVLASAAVVWAARGGGPLGATIALASVPWLTAPLLLWLHARRRVPVDTIRVAVGERLPPFQALTPEGTPFRTEELAGQRVLLKFFRGEWCPFCQAELKRFDEMEPELRVRGVRVLALSKDTPEAASRHRERDGLRLGLLCDPDLTVIRSFGLEHRKALEISAGPRIRLFGLAVGTRPAFRTMAAPTSLLVDETGVIRWIDQTDDYKVRSSSQRVLQAIDDTFGAPARRPEVETPTQVPVVDDLACADC